MCIDSRVDAAVVAFGGDHALVDELRDAGVFVFVMVGTDDQVHRAVSWTGSSRRGSEAGGHLCGTDEARRFLPRALTLADGRPVLLAGGIATGDDTRAALAEGAGGVIAGTRFLLTHESRAHPEYQRRILAARKTFSTMLFGLGWPAPHRVIANAATERWCRDDGTVKAGPRLINARSGILAKLPANASVYRIQTPRLPLFSPVAPTVGDACFCG